MTSNGSVPRYQLYPRRYFDESATWFAWNKLTAADVCALREEPGFEGQNIYFWLNNPIQLVRLVGMVVQIDSVANGKYTLITLDDSSGENIEVKIEKRVRSPGDVAEYPSNTLIDSVDVLVEMGTPIVYIDKKPVDIGDVLRAQGTITSFRQERQLALQRIGMVKDTNEEAYHWAKAAEWKRTVLSKPWVLTRQQMDAADEKERKKEKRDRKKARAKRKVQAIDDADRRKEEAEREETREADELAMDVGALRGSHILPLPWD